MPFGITRIHRKSLKPGSVERHKSHLQNRGKKKKNGQYLRTDWGVGGFCQKAGSWNNVGSGKKHIFSAQAFRRTRSGTKKRREARTVVSEVRTGRIVQTQPQRISACKGGKRRGEPRPDQKRQNAYQVSANPLRYANARRDASKGKGAR